MTRTNNKPPAAPRYEALQVRNSVPHLQKVLMELNDRKIIAVMPTMNNVHVIIIHEALP